MTNSFNLRIISSNNQDLLSRKEFLYDLTFSGAVPSREAIKKEVVGNERTNPDVVVIRKIATEFGFGKGKVLVYVYSDKKALEEIEKEYFAKRGLPKEKKTEEEKKKDKPAEEKTEEKPAEEKKEGQKEDVKEETKQEEKKGDAEEKKDKAKEEKTEGAKPEEKKEGGQ